MKREELISLIDRHTESEMQSIYEYIKLHEISSRDEYIIEELDWLAEGDGLYVRVIIDNVDAETIYEEYGDEEHRY